MPVVAWQLLGIGSGWLIHRTANGRRLGAVFAGLLATIWTGTLLTTFVEIPKVTQIFVWRFAPNADLMGEILVACALAQIVARPRILRSYAPVAIGLVCAGLGLFGLYFRNKDGALPRLLLCFFGLAVLARLLDLGLALLTRLLPTQSALLATVQRWLARTPILIGAIALYGLAPDHIAQGLRRSTLLKEEGGSQADLYRWLREESPKDAVYLTPPDLEGTRYLGQRAIVVDWKAVPLIPTELLGWYERLCDVTGRHVGGLSDMGGYGSMDSERLALIVHKYHPDYVVLRHGGERRFPGLPIAYQNGGYSVLKIAGIAP
jgi:hypothetical protein